MKKFKLTKIILACIVFAVFANAEDKKSIIKGLETNVEYSIYSNMLYRGESISNNNVGSLGAVNFSYSGLNIGYSTFTITNATEVDLAIGYTVKVSENTDAYIAYLGMDESGEKYESSVAKEASVGMQKKINESYTIGFDYTKDIKNNNMQLFQIINSIDVSKLSIGVTFGLSKYEEDKENDHEFYMLALGYPCALSTGEWGLGIGNTNKKLNEEVYYISHTFTF